MSGSESSRTLRFALFEVDLRAGELRKHGIKVKLQDQPFQVLAMLLAARGEVVTREELRTKLWPADTFVDFDTGLNTAVKRLREALGDSAESPRYVGTLPRKGYRFIYPIDKSQEAVQTSAVETAVQVKIPRPDSFRRHVRIVVPTLLLASVALVLAGFRYRRPRPALTDQDVIVLADFENRTGEPVFDKTLREALSVSLEQSPFFNVMPGTRVDQILKQMTRSPGDSITAEIGREICLRSSTKALLTGSIATLGSHYALQIRATNCQTGNTLAAASAEAGSRERVLEALGQAATRLRSRLGESLPSVQKYDKPLEEAMTSSLEALQAYSEGARIYRQKGDDAIPFFKRAVELDPSFAYAYSYLGAIYSNIGESSLERENLSKGFALRDRLTVLHQYMAAGLYYEVVTGELEKARQQFQLAAQEYPNDSDSCARINLGNTHSDLGQHEQALTEFREAVRQQPDNSLGYKNLSSAYMSLGRLDEAYSTLSEASARKLDSPLLHRAMYYLAFLRDDTPAMQRELNWAMGKPVDESFALASESSTQAYYGRLWKARQLSREAVARAFNNGAKIPAANFKAQEAIVEAELGRAAQARQIVRTALALSQEQETRLNSALVLASAGDSSAAEKQIENLSKDYPLDTLLQIYWLPAIHARIELNSGHAQRALQLLESAKPYDLTAASTMYSVNVRGRAYLARGDGAAAAAEYQKILDHRGLVKNDVIGVLAHLYLGRARALEAQSLNGTSAADARTKARAAYQDFLNLWKDADPDIPVLHQARTEYAKLQ